MNLENTVKYHFAKSTLIPGGVNPTADPTAFSLQTFWLDTKTSEDDEVVSWSLSSPADLQNLVIPTRQITSLCEWALRGQYRSGDGCTYNDTAYFDAKGNVVTDPALDVCGGCLSDCRKRFGAGLADPNTAIPRFRRLSSNRAFLSITGHLNE